MMQKRECLEVRDRICLVEVRGDPCGDECALDGTNWCPGMPNHGRRPRGWPAMRESSASDPENVTP